MDEVTLKYAHFSENRELLRMEKVLTFSIVFFFNYFKLVWLDIPNVFQNNISAISQE